MKKRWIPLILAITIILGFIPRDLAYAQNNKQIDPMENKESEQREDKPLLSFDVISDTHIPGTDDSNETNEILINTLDNIKKEHPNTSLVMNCGDFTDRGSENEMRGYYNILGRYTDFDFMTGLGNHEVMHINFAEAKERFLRYNNKYMPRNRKNVYYDKWVNGYHFIMLGTEHLLHLESYISNEQLEWLDKTMAEGADPNKPIFVGLHQPLRDTFENANRWPVGVQDYAIKEVLRKYPQTILFTGHLHDGLGSVEVLERDFGTMVNVPSLRSNEKTSPGGTQGELGFHVRVYEDEVKIDLKDYKSNTWVSENSYTVDLDPKSRPVGKILDLNFDGETADDLSGYENHLQGIEDIEFVKGRNGGKSIRLINENYPTEINQYIKFSEIDLADEDFTLVFSYKDEEKNQWHGATAVIEQESKDTLTLYINGRRVNSIKLNGTKYHGLDQEIFKLIVENNGDLRKRAKNLIIDDFKLYKYALGAAEIETINVPFNIYRGSNNIELLWENTMPSNRKPAYVSINGKKYSDISSDQTSLNISNLESDRLYDVKVVTRYSSNQNLAGVYSFKVKTLEADVNKDNLLRLYNLHKNKKKEDYEDKTWEKFHKALEKARLVLEDRNAIGEAIEEAIEDLVAAVEGLGQWIYKDGHGWWYRNSDGSWPRNEWMLIGGNYYYFDKGGYRVSGWLDYKNNWYYLNNNGAMEKGWLSVDKIWYFMDESGVMKTGWHKEAGDYYYLNSKGHMETGWIRYNGSWYYMAGSGLMKKGWVEDKGQKYYLNNSGVMETGWVSVGGKWYYLSKSGIVQTGWLEDKGKTYYLKDDGEMSTGWTMIGSKWYYMNISGIIQKDWQKIDGKWYYMNSDGVMEKGWLQESNKWYYLASSGAMEIGWAKVGSKWYYMNSSGVMETGWIKLGGKWYYLANSGSMETGWTRVGNKWYYMNTSGVMQTGWIKVGGKDYYLYADGSMASNTSINGYRVGNNGAWIK